MFGRTRMFAAAALAVAMAGSGHAPMLMPSPPEIRGPSVREVRRGSRTSRQWGKTQRRIRDRELKRAAEARKQSEARRRFDKDRADVQTIVRRLTNWQRSQWARAGYPGLRIADAVTVARFAEMVRP